MIRHLAAILFITIYFFVSAQDLDEKLHEGIFLFQFNNVDKIHLIYLGCMKQDRDSDLFEEQIKEMFKVKPVQTPKALCPNNNPASLLCANKLCQHPSYFCSQPNCQVCSQHQCCFFVPIARVTNSLNSKLQYLSEIKRDLWKINKRMIDQLQKNLASFCEESERKIIPPIFYSTIENIYEKNFQPITGKQVQELCSYLDGQICVDQRNYLFSQYQQSADELQEKLFTLKINFLEQIEPQESKYMISKKQMQKQLWKLKHCPDPSEGQAIDQFFFVNTAPSLNKKVVILGETAVGKTNIIRCLSGDPFVSAHIPSNGSRGYIQNGQKCLNYQTLQINLQIQNSSGNKSYRRQYLNCGDTNNFIIFVYDVASPSSLSELIKDKQWNQIITKYRWKVPMLLLGNKADQSRKVNINDAKYLAMRNGMELHEVSVKDNLQQLIQILTEFIGKKSLYGQRVKQYNHKLPMKDGYLFFLLHLLEDFDDDLLHDAIDLLADTK